MIEFSPETARIIVLVAMFALITSMFIKKFKPTAAFVLVVLVLLVLNIIPLKKLLVNMANESVVVIFLLIFITTALRKHFNLIGIIDKLFRKIKNPRIFLFSFTSFVSMLSSVINNTPIVALFIPYVYSWAKRNKMAPSKFLIPLSYAATLGGTITLIGTSTNLVLNGLLVSNGMEPLGFFDFLVPGLLVTFFGLILMATLGYYLLPSHKDLLEKFENNKRSYIVETQISETSVLVGKQVQQAGLRNLDDLYLVEILRNGNLISPVSPNETLFAKDLLYFAGDTHLVSTLVAEKSLGLVFPKIEKFNLGDELIIVEALVPAMSDLGGLRVKDSNFRERYDAAIVAVLRHGEKLGGKIGNQQLEFGDLLLLTAGKNFKNQTDKNLISLNTKPLISAGKKREKKIFGIAFLTVCLAWAFGFFNILVGLMLLQFVLLATRLSTFSDLKKQFNPDLYLILVGAISFGTAMLDTGTADWFVQLGQDHLAHLGSKALLISLFLITLLLTSFVTNVAAVSIAFPIAVALLPQLDVAPSHVFLTIAFAASCAFLTPVAYQTNLMVYEPGSYRSVDFFKIGLPLTVVYALICIAYFGWS